MIEFLDDPPLLPSGECAVCPKRRPVVSDPFCSTECCQRYYTVMFLDRTGRPLYEARKGYRTGSQAT